MRIMVVMKRMMIVMIMKEVQTVWGAHTASNIQGSWLLLPGVKFLERKFEYISHLVLRM